MQSVSESHWVFALAMESASLVPILSTALDASNLRTSFIVVLPCTANSSYGFVFGSAAWVDPMSNRSETKSANIDMQVAFVIMLALSWCAKPASCAGDNKKSRCLRKLAAKASGRG